MENKTKHMMIFSLVLSTQTTLIQMSKQCCIVISHTAQHKITTHNRRGGKAVPKSTTHQNAAHSQKFRTPRSSSPESFLFFSRSTKSLQLLSDEYNEMAWLIPDSPGVPRPCWPSQLTSQQNRAKPGKIKSTAGGCELL